MNTKEVSSVIELKKNLYWVGVKDWELKKFHGEELSTHRGSTYNSYLIKDAKTVLVDTVWGPFKEAYVSYLEREVGLENIDFIVVNHSETDHSGALPYLMSKIPNTPIYCTQNGEKMLKKHYHQDWNFHVVKTGDSVNIGEYELVFVEMPMLHWPDSMATYVKGANVLLSNDAFGQHYATSKMFNDEVDECALYQEAIKYYANILTPFSHLVKNKIEQIKSLNLPIDMIAPSHGVIWRQEPLQIVEKYYQWAQEYHDNSVVIAYDTMWEGTKKMAQAIGEGLAEQGVAVKLYNVAKKDKNDVITEMFKAKGILLGSSTINNGILSGLAALLEEIKGLKFKNKVAAAFGSYGWSGEGVKIITQRLEEAKLQVVEDGIKFTYQPDLAELAQCKEFGKRFAAHLK
ncbi:MAG: anaerobic nitric oxide reductase flavorubredoxin [Carboxydocellales bacterium]